MTSIRDLPTELLLRIAQHLRGKDSHSFRLTCKAFVNPGGCALLETFSLYISNFEPLPSLEKLMDRPRLMECINDLDLWLFDDKYQGVALEFFSKLPKLAGLTFDMPYSSNQSQVLHSILAEIHRKPSALRRLHLRIRFGMDSAEHGFIPDEATTEVLQSVHDLHLHLEQYDDRNANIYRPWSGHEDYRHVLTRPCSTWLSPDFINVRRLTLDFGSGWVATAGFAPKLDFRNTYFRNLNYLSLSHFLICHDWVLEWLSKHGSTLETLDLAFCPILRRRATEYVLDDEGYPNTDPPRKALFNVTIYPTTWSTIFGKLLVELSSLRKFTLIWFAGISPNDHTTDPMHPSLLLRLYDYYESLGYHVDPQMRIGDMPQTTQLLQDEDNLNRLVDKIGRENCTVEPVREEYARLPDIDTSGTEWYEVDDVLDDWTVDSHDNIYTFTPLPQPTRED